MEILNVDIVDNGLYVDWDDPEFGKNSLEVYRIDNEQATYDGRITVYSEKETSREIIRNVFCALADFCIKTTNIK